MRWEGDTRLVVKCGVCGSENEPEALFCGTCGSPLGAAAPKPVDEGAATPEGGDDVVIPGKKNGKGREAGAGGETGTIIDVKPPDEGTTTEPVQPRPDAGQPAGPTIVCAVCGTLNDATRTYCRKCASELKPAAPTPTPKPVIDGGRRITPLMLGIGGLVALGVVVLLVAVFALGGKPGATASPVPSAPASAGVSEPPPSPGATEPAETEPAFTEGDPSGRIVFARCPSGANCRLMVINADGSGLDEITDPATASATDPGFSTDGKRVAYVTRAGLRILDLESGDITTQSSTRGDTNPFWSPDDSQLLFAGFRVRDPGSNDADLEIRLDSTVDEIDSEPLTNNAIQDHDPVFTPDGKSLIWVQGEGDGRELMRMDLGTREVTQLTDDSFNDVDPAVSPDGTKLAFASTRGGGDEFDVYLMDTSTLEITLAAEIDGTEHDPAWSPGGRYLVFSGSDGRLYVLDLADGSVNALTSPDGRDLAPAWR